MRQAAQVIHELEGQSNEISKVLDVIRGIAEQTNLLALNAAI
ncbi:methyl-accepting chemotaxis protein, partial [Salmonella enterica]|nr:methyl-accepting chemotaxis protein [Salmonella enterica]